MRPIPPPPVLVLLLGALMWFTARHAWTAPPWPGRSLLAGALVGAGLLIGALALHRFWRAGTTVNPLRPDAVSELVTGGVYRLSRNPMYLADVLFLLAWGLHLGAPVNLFFIVLFVLLINWFQIAPEEQVLARRFGNEYAAYRQRVRRWI